VVNVSEERLYRHVTLVFFGREIQGQMIHEFTQSPLPRKVARSEPG